MNESQKRESRFWAKWRASGSVGTALTAETDPIRKKPMAIIGIRVDLGDPDNITSTLSIGERPVSSGVFLDGSEWKTTVPVLSVVVPGKSFVLGQQIRAKDLPAGTKTLQEHFVSRKK